MTDIKTQKSNLAKLMATENITVIHKKIPTAYFDVKNRILACPTFKEDMSNELYDLFMGHEVGHALYTPYEGLHSTLKKNRTLKGYLNVIEDVRIEKGIRNKYAGLRKSFFKAYDELMQRDFFGLKGRDLQTLALIDKINLITKCGSRVSITLNEEETEWLKKAESCKTWEDVVEVSEALYNWSKENETRDEEDKTVTTQQIPDFEDDEEENEEEGNSYDLGQDDDEDEEDEEEVGSSSSNQDGEDEEQEESEQIRETGKKGGDAHDENFSQHDDEDGAREALTEHNAHNNEDMFVDENARIKTFIDLKKKFKQNPVDDILYSYDKVLNDWRKFRGDVVTDQELLKKGETFRKYLQSKNKKIVSHMAKEFEMRQTAMRSLKAYTGKSGDLDMNRLAKYQIVDDIFKRVTYIPDGKNHGVNVLLDWSGSISYELEDLIEQSIILAEFCRLVQIPFRVYAFSDQIETADAYDYSSRGGKLVEFLSNEMNSRQYTEMLNNMALLMLNKFHSDVFYSYTNLRNKRREEYNKVFGVLIDDESAWDIRYKPGFSGDHRPHNYRLGGTPLNHTLVGLRKFLPEFNKKYGIEKSILTVITDGYSHGSDYLRESEEENADRRSQTDDSWREIVNRYILDPYSNKVYPYDTRNERYGYNDFELTQNLLEWISDTCNVTVTGYFVFSKKGEFTATISDIKSDGDGYDYLERDQMWREMKKTGVVIKTKGYNKLFLTCASTLGATGDDELDDDLVGAKKSRVMAAFKRNQKGKTTSRFLTNEFIKEIA
jgi:hypothetical protein